MRRKPLAKTMGDMTRPETTVARAVRSALVCGSVFALSSTLVMGPAWSQTAVPPRGRTDDARRGPELEEVVVTATRRDSSILDVPYAISAISGREIERQGVRDLSDLVRVVPGIAYMDQGPRVANNNNYIILRGLNATSQTGAGDTPFLAQPAVSTYFGSIPVFANFQTADMNRVEVLRGPQGTLYGSGSLGGTLRFMPNTPDVKAASLDTSAELSTTDHSDKLSYDLSAVWNQPLSDTSALRVAAGRRELGGFIDYVGLVQPDAKGYPIPDGATTWKTQPRKKDGNGSTDWYVRAMGSFDVADNSHVLLTWQHQKVDVANRQSQSAGFASSGITENYVQLIPYQEPLKSEMDLLGMDVEVHLGFATLSSSTSYTTSKANWARDATGLYDKTFSWYKNYYYPYTTVISVGDSSQQIIAQEFRLVSEKNPDSKWDWVAGLYYMDQDFSVNEVQSIPGLKDYVINVNPGSVSKLPTTDVTYPAERNWKFKDKALFGELTYNITRQWHVTGGARVFSQDYNQLFVFHAPFCPSFFYPPASLTCGDPGGDGITTTTRLAKSISDHIFKFNTSYDISDRQKVYFTWSEGMRHGGANAVPTQGPYPEDPGIYEAYDADKATNWEVGFKGSTADRAFSYTLAAFHIDWKKTQFDTFTEKASFSAIVNGANAKSNGLELELAGRLLDNWTYTLGYDYTKSEWDVDGHVGHLPLFKGDQLPGVPKQMATLSTEYRWPVEMGDVSVRADGFYRSSTNSAPNSAWANYEQLSGFSLWNFSVGLEKDKWGARVFLNNAFNKLGITGGELESSYLQYAYHFVQRPRTVGVQLHYKLK
jgi:iron complex outermembrane recepter protein